MIKINQYYKQFKEQLEDLPTRTRIAVLIGGVILLLLFISCILILISHQKPLNDDSNLSVNQRAQQVDDARQAQHESEIRADAEQAIANGDMATADKIYDDVIQVETNIEQKLQLYIDHSNVLYTAGKYSEAIDVAKRAESVGDDKYLVADWLSRIYEDQKQYRLAADYYTLAGKWASSPMNKTQSNQEYYDRQALRVLEVTTP